MGNCVLKGINIITRHGNGISGEEKMVKVVTSNGGIMELYTPITVDFITSEFPGHGIFHSRERDRDDELFSSEPHHHHQPLLKNEELHAGEVYYLLPLNNYHCSSSCGVMTSSSSRRKNIISRQVSNASSTTSTPHRMFTYDDNSSRKIIGGSEAEISPRQIHNNKSSGAGEVWKVRLVISPHHLSEIFSEDSLTEALIDSLRTVAKCANGLGFYPMGKSWLTAVKRAFRSPTKDTHKKSKTRDDTADQDKRDRRRWIFRKPANQETETETVVSTQTKVKPSSTADQVVSVVAVAAATDEKHAVAVAVATAQATMEVESLNNRGIGRDRKQYHYAAIVIQTAFRGYLARRALRALKGLVKLQALVRGHNVRKQALRCMQALVRVQTQSRVLEQRTRFSHEGSSSRKSTFSDTNSVWESRYVQDISDRKSMSREGSSIASDWDERPHTVEEVKAMLQRRKEAAAAMKRDKSLSQQIRRNGGTSSMANEDDLEERPKRMDRWMTTKPWENRGRASTDQRDPIKTVEIESSYLGPNNYRRSHPNYQYNPQRHSIASPHHRSNQNASIVQHSPATPSPAKARPIQVRSASPRYSREDRSYHTSQTPNLRLNNNNHHNNNNYRGNVCLSSRGGTSNGGAGMPNYMAATESAKARIRSQSAPRQRASTPERERDRVGSARKRLSYPAPAAHDPSYNVGMGYGHRHRHSLRSPSFKSVSGSHFGLEQHSNYSSCCTDSFAGEISPSSTTDLRRWLR